jgi:hypothetical protein
MMHAGTVALPPGTPQLRLLLCLLVYLTWGWLDRVPSSWAKTRPHDQ